MRPEICRFSTCCHGFPERSRELACVNVGRRGLPRGLPENKEESMSIPLSRSMQVDVGEAFGFVFRSRTGSAAWRSVPSVCCSSGCCSFRSLSCLAIPWKPHGPSAAADVNRLPGLMSAQSSEEGFVLAVALFIWGLPGSILSGAVPPSIAWHRPIPTLPNALAPLWWTLHAAAWLADSGDLEPVSGGRLYIRL